MRYYALRKSRSCHDWKRYAALRISVAATSCANSTSQTDFGRAGSGMSVIDRDGTDTALPPGMTGSQHPQGIRKLTHDQ